MIFDTPINSLTDRKLPNANYALYNMNISSNYYNISSIYSWFIIVRDIDAINSMDYSGYAWISLD